MLSDNDIRKKFGKDIAIYPFIRENVEGASVYVTASKLAWSLNTKQNIVEGGKIRIQKNDTAIIVTNESIYISENLAGVCHARVGLTISGFGHLGTPIKPGSTGRLLIAIHNNCQNEDFLDIDVLDIAPDGTIAKPESGRIAVLMFHELVSNASSSGLDGKRPTSLLGENGYNLSQENRDEFEKKINTDKGEIIKKMKEDSKYKKYRKETRLKSISFRDIFFDIVLVFFLFLLIWQLMIIFTVKVDSDIVKRLFVTMPVTALAVGYVFKERIK